MHSKVSVRQKHGQFNPASYYLIVILNASSLRDADVYYSDPLNRQAGGIADAGTPEPNHFRSISVFAEHACKWVTSIIQARLDRPLCLFGRMAQVDPEGLEASDG